MISVTLSVTIPARPVHASVRLSLDGIGTDATCGGSSTVSPRCSAQVLTTNYPDDVIILVVDCIGYAGCPVDVSSVVDSSGLIFEQRTSYSPSDRIWEYYARSAFPLVSDNITAVLSSDWTQHSMQVFAINGAGHQIFLPNPAFPETTLCVAFAVPCSATVTSSANDFVIASTLINDSAPCTIPPGFTKLAYVRGILEVDYRAPNVPPSKLTYSCADSGPVAIVIDVISFNGQAP
jgi:hypothetical protein